MRRRAATVLLVCAGLACAHTPPALDPQRFSREARPEAFDIPAVLAGFEQSEVHRYDEPGLGFQVRYRARDSSDAHADVYLYPIFLPPGASLGYILELQQRQLDSEIGLVVQTARGSVGPSELEAWEPPEGFLAGGLLGYRELTLEGRELRSHSFLTVSHDLFVKVRMSVPEAEAARDDDAFEPFLLALSESLSERDPWEPRELRISIGPDLFELAEDRQCDLQAWLGYGIALAAALRAGRYLDTFDRELEARDLATTLWDKRAGEADSDCGSAVLAAHSAARRAGYLREYLWERHRRILWQRPVDLDLEGYRRWAETGLPDHEPVQLPPLNVDWPDGDENEEE